MDVMSIASGQERCHSISKINTCIWASYTIDRDRKVEDHVHIEAYAHSINNTFLELAKYRNE
jgi:hypothetical protein